MTGFSQEISSQGHRASLLCAEGLASSSACLPAHLWALPLGRSPEVGTASGLGQGVTLSRSSVFVASHGRRETNLFQVISCVCLGTVFTNEALLTEPGTERSKQPGLTPLSACASRAGTPRGHPASDPAGIFH